VAGGSGQDAIPETTHRRGWPQEPKNDDNAARVIGQMRQYILDFQETRRKDRDSKTALDQMLARYPEWLNRGALWSSAAAQEMIKWLRQTMEGRTHETPCEPSSWIVGPSETFIATCINSRFSCI